MTPLDRAFAAFGEDEVGRRVVYATLAATPLVVALERPADGDRIEPLVLETGEGQFALAFDSEERLGGFLPRGTDYAVVPGRGLIGMLAGAGLGLGVNLEVAPSALLLSAEDLGWIVAEAAGGEARAVAQVDPGVGDAPGVLVEALALRAGELEGMCSGLCPVVDEQGVLVVALDVPAGAKAALLAGMAELAGMLGLAGGIGVVFEVWDGPVHAAVDGPVPELDFRPVKHEPKPGPGMDPDNPPRLI